MFNQLIDVFLSDSHMLHTRESRKPLQNYAGACGISPELQHALEESKKEWQDIALARYAGELAFEQAEWIGLVR